MKQSDPLLTIIIPTYNEADNLADIAQALFELPIDNLQLLIVDDNSPDGTGELADRLAAQYNRPADSPHAEGRAHTEGRTHTERRPRLDVLHRTGKGGLGTAYIAGMKHALDNGAAYILQMDADFSHSPHYIPQMLGVMLATQADVDEEWSWWRRWLSWFANLYSRLILNLRIRDMTAGFKLWRREALLGIDLDRIRSNGYSFQVEMAYVCEKLGYRLIEIPIHFEDRRIGQSKMDVPVKLESAWRTWQIWWRYRRMEG